MVGLHGPPILYLVVSVTSPVCPPHSDEGVTSCSVNFFDWRLLIGPRETPEPMGVWVLRNVGVVAAKILYGIRSGDGRDWTMMKVAEKLISKGLCDLECVRSGRLRWVNVLMRCRIG